MSKTTTYTVTIGNQETRVRIPHDVETDYGLPPSTWELKLIVLDRAVKKMYGKHAFWHTDPLNRSMGQVWRHARTGGWDAVTRTVGVNIK